MDEQNQQEQNQPEGTDHPEGATGATGATVGKEVTDQLPESERNYSGNLGNDVKGGPGFTGGGVAPSSSQRDASGGGSVSDTGSAAGAPIEQAKVPNRQGESGMGAAGSSADVSQEEYNRTHEEDGSLTAEAQKEHEEQHQKNLDNAQKENERILGK